jgi:hypothetical protein
VSRSNPHDNGAPNPAVRWFEWNGEKGVVRYYDKTAKQNIDVPLPFSFVLLDQLGTVKGWHEASQSGIYANEVKDTRQGVMVVKAFKGGTLAEGRYREIKDRVNALGGQFVSNCYIAFKHEDELAIGSIRFKGAALGAWMEFTKANRAELYRKAIAIGGFTEGKKGRVIFRVPTFGIVGLSADSNNQAVALDLELQKFLTGYLKRTTRDQVEHVADVHDYEGPPPDDYGEPPASTITDDDIPF